jgi:hypothetical protein
MPQDLKRRPPRRVNLPRQVNIRRNDLHFITFCCYHDKRLLDLVQCRNMVVRLQEKVEKE